jgi:outer membrane protein assembly factor BamB
VALTRRTDKRWQCSIACYDGTRGTPVWTQPILEVFERDEQAPRPLQLMTLAAPNLVCCTHAGAIVAIDRNSGKPAWAFRYPSSDTVAEREPRPCLYDRQRVFAAPLDSRQVFCLDAASGVLLWERDNIVVKQLLGVAAGRLLVTTPDGLRALDVQGGCDAWQQPAIGRLATAGRGCLAGGWVFWPTRELALPVRAISVADGSQELFRRKAPSAYFEPTQLRLLRPGNFAIANGCVIVAGPGELFGYGAPSTLH